MLASTRAQLIPDTFPTEPVEYLAETVLAMCHLPAAERTGLVAFSLHYPWSQGMKVHSLDGGQALPALLDSGRGVVVNFTSTAASFAHPYMAAYAASKGGVLSFTHSLALEYSKLGLRAVNIQPGGVATALALSTLDKMPDGYDLALWAKQTPLLHGEESDVLGDPGAVAAAIAMVASDDGAFITGTEIRIDGGAHA